MIVRDFRKEDRAAAEAIYALYWTDEAFLEELSEELRSFDSGNKKRGLLVAEENAEIVGVGGFWDCPEYLKPYSKTEVPAELHVLASKYKNKGIGGALRLKVAEEAARRGYTEIILYSPDTHRDSWAFHDGLGERAGSMIAPDGYPGQVWRIPL